MAKDKPQPKNVQKLIAAQNPKPPKKKPTVAKRMTLRGGKPKPKGKPDAVFKLIGDALKRKER